ncbi:hypothetical protein AVEN_17950-2-1, partial [Araneus ventricosus]
IRLGGLSKGIFNIDSQKVLWPFREVAM